jgi:hypothetical protein
MKRFGGVRNPRSGARWDRRNDGRTDTELIEFKRTDNRRSITLLADHLDALYRHAVAECRFPVLGFELCGRHWVVLPEPDYHELAAHRPASGTTRRLRAAATDLDGPGQVPRAARQPVLRRVPAQQLPGARGQVGVPGNPPGPPRPLPRDRGVPRLRDRQRGEVRSLGRVLRKRAAPDQAPAEPTTP